MRGLPGGERLFTAEAAPPSLATGLRPGEVLVLRGGDPAAPTSHALTRLRPADPVGAGLRELTVPRTAAVLLPGGCSREVWLAVRFALHLAARRRGGPAPGPCLVGAGRPGPLPGGAVAVPHLVAAVDGDQISSRISDRVVWEVMTAARAHAWLPGRPLSVLETLTGYLPGLLALRARHRAQALTGPGLAPLHRVLTTQDRYLSILFAATHLDQVRRALDALATQEF